MKSELKNYVTAKTRNVLMAGDWEALILENLIKSWTAQKLNGGLDNTKFDVRVLMMIFYFF